ncbi:MAG: alpha-glucuronidase family glycosyl hydrolase [Armatimonadetes bacterium]|nr:alpha-glucuronidase family glycosyl hydrolase [Armatimonadota bacterium]
MRLWMLVAAVAALCLAGRAAAAGADVDLTRAEIVLGSGTDRLEALAARELQRYLGLMGAGRCRIVPQAQGAGTRLVLGTPHSSSDVARLIAATKTAGTLGDEGYLLHTRPGRVTLAASTPRGVLWAAYGLLERLGVGFFLGGDALAGAGPARLPEGLSLVERPALKVRGSLPWYNFLDSPTTWDRDDFRFFFDQMARMRMNFVGFHSYDSEPFCAYEFGGKLIGG